MSVGVIQKLFTREDHFAFHKISGFLVLLNYLAQHVNFELNADNRGELVGLPFVLIPHITLHLSSFMFHVISRRKLKTRATYFIWNELRLHAMIFSLRAVFVILALDRLSDDVLYRARVGIHFATMALADIATHMYGDRSVTTVRGGAESGTSQSGIKRAQKAGMRFFFSTSQFGASLICAGLVSGSDHMILAFGTLPGIQLSAFLMTLVRKNIIHSRTWKILYVLCLGYTYYLYYRLNQNVSGVAIPAVTMYLLRRFVFTSTYGKYPLWMMAFVVVGIANVKKFYFVFA